MSFLGIENKEPMATWLLNPYSGILAGYYL